MARGLFYIFCDATERMVSVGDGVNSKYFRGCNLSLILFGILLGSGCGQNLRAPNGQSGVQSPSTTLDDPSTIPTVEIFSGPASPNSLVKQIFTFGSDDSTVTFECNLDGKGFVACDTPFEIPTAELANGEHRLVLRGKNGFGKFSPSTLPYVWNVVKVTPPLTSNSVIEQAISSGKCTARANNQILCADIVYDVLEPANRAADLKLDLYLQKNPIGKHLPLIVYIHGGGWMTGNRKDDCQKGVLDFVSKGYAVACITYRRTRVIEDVPGEKIPTAIFPAQIQDVRTAVQFLRKHAGTTFDTNRFCAWGASAGGHLAALLGTSADDPTLEGRGGASVSSRVHAVINYSGPSNLDFFVTASMTASQTFPEALVGGPSGKSPSVLTYPAKDAIIKQIDPASWLDKDDPPMLIIHSVGDETVPVESSRYLHQKLKDAGVDSIYIERPGSGHSFVPMHIPEQAEDFLKEHL